MTIHWKAVKQYFTVVLFVNPLTPRVKPWVIQSFLTFDSMYRTSSVTIHWKAVEQNLTVVLFVFHFYPVSNFEKKLSILDSVLSGVKGLTRSGFYQMGNLSFSFLNILLHFKKKGETLPFRYVRGYG